MDEEYVIINAETDEGIRDEAKQLVAKMLHFCTENPEENAILWVCKIALIRIIANSEDVPDVIKLPLQQTTMRQSFDEPSLRDFAALFGAGMIFQRDCAGVYEFNERDMV